MQINILGIIGVAVIIYGLILLIYPNPRLVLLNAAIKLMEERTGEREIRRYIRLYSLGVIVVGAFLFWLAFNSLSDLFALFPFNK